MTDLSVQTVDTTLAVAGTGPTQLVAALDPLLVLQVAPSGAALSVEVAQAGVLVAPAEQGPVGPQGVPGPPGPAGGVSFHYVQAQPSAAWTIAHNLGRYPSVTIVDTAGDQVSADVTYVDANTVTVSFGFPTTGAAYLN